MKNKDIEYEIRYLKIFEKYGYRPHEFIMSFGSTEFTPSQFAKHAIRGQDYELYILENSRSKEEFDEYIKDEIKCKIPWYEKIDRAIIHANIIEDYESAKEFKRIKRIDNIKDAILSVLFMTGMIAAAVGLFEMIKLLLD